MELSEIQNTLLIDYLPSVKETANWWNDKEFKEKTHFDVVKYENVLYPKNGYGKKNETFIYGKGYVKGKVSKVPKFSGYVKDYENYVKEYGADCLYHTLTNGRFLEENDCATLRSREEFRQLVHFGIEKFLPYMINYIELDKIVYNTLLSYYPNENDFWFKHAYGDFKLRPQYHLLCSYFPYPASMDVVNDDNKILLAYCEIEWLKELKRTNTNYWENHGKSDFTIKIMEDSENDRGAFPSCMEKRIEIVYGEKAAKLYKSLISIS